MMANYSQNIVIKKGKENMKKFALLVGIVAVMFGCTSEVKTEVSIKKDTVTVDSSAVDTAKADTVVVDSVKADSVK